MSTAANAQRRSRLATLPEDQGDLPDERTKRAIEDSFGRLYYHDTSGTWMPTRYRGIPVWKCPLDLWIYQSWRARTSTVIPCSRGSGPGPMEAVGVFLQANDDFEADRSLEKFHMTFNPRGFLRRR